MKKIAVIFLFFAPFLNAEDLRFNPRLDIPILLGSTAFAGFAEFAQQERPLPDSFSFDVSRVNPLDRPIAGLYRPVLSDISLATELSTIVLPSLAYALFTPDSGTLLTDFAIIGETVSLNFTILQIVKSAVMRPRPYNYPPSSSEGSRPAPRDFRSFYSAHTAVTFGIATALTFIAHERGVPPAGMYLIAGSSYALAAATGILRIVSGEHFPTDVLAGAIIGSALAYLTVELHRTE